MNDMLPPFQDLYEISLAIGNHPDLGAMLDESIPLYLRRLRFDAGAVFRLKAHPENSFGYEEVYSFPDTRRKEALLIALVKAIPKRLGKQELDRLISAMPLVGQIDSETRYCAMRLDGFGFVAFATNGYAMDDHIIRALIPLNRKLAQSCIACDNNEHLKREIVTRQRSEKSLAESEERLRIILSSVQAGLAIVDAEGGVIVEINAHASRLLGYAQEALIGRQYEEIFEDEGGECAAVAATGAPPSSSGRTVVNSKRGLVPVLKTVTPVLLQNRRHLLVSFVDLSEIIKAEEEKERLENLLRQSQKMEAIGTLAGGIAHDFNNLLTPILGLAQLCLEEPGDSEYMSENIEEIYSAGMRAKELVNQILTFSRRAEESLVPLQPNTIVKETLKLMRASLPTTIDIRRNIQSEGTILGVPTQIQQIVMNLCTNAAHAMKAEGGVLDVRLADEVLEERFVEMYPGKKSGQYVKLTVSDTGTGIPEGVADAIFEPYFTTKKPDEGTGLGLALVHSIVESYRGIIRFDTELGKGTTFEIYLPVLERREPLRSEPVHDLPTGTESILLVDDELPIVNFGKKLLSRLGYSVTVRTSSIEALGLFRKTASRFDLVISDMTMANMTGDKLAAEMKRIRPDIPVIIFTGYSDQLQARNITELGIQALLHKPITASDIARTVREVLDARGE